jgi:hypothetical protein
VKRKAKAGRCGTPSCPYTGTLTKHGLCTNCAAWVRRWSKATSSHWDRFVGAFHLREARITTFNRPTKNLKAVS